MTITLCMVRSAATPSHAAKLTPGVVVICWLDAQAPSSRWRTATSPARSQCGPPRAASTLTAASAGRRGASCRCVLKRPQHVRELHAKLTAPRTSAGHEQVRCAEGLLRGVWPRAVAAGRQFPQILTEQPLREARGGQRSAKVCECNTRRVFTPRTARAPGRSAASAARRAGAAAASA